MGTTYSKEELAQADKQLEALLEMKPGFNLRPEQSKNIYKILNILVVGLQHSGKSSFVNSVLRVFNKELETNMKIQAPTAPSTASHCTLFFEEYQPKNGFIRLLDCKAPTVLEADEVNFFKSCILHGLKPLSKIDQKNMTYAPEFKIHASILLVSPEQLGDEGKRFLIQKLAGTLGNFNRKPIVVLTHKDEMNKEKEHKLLNEAKKLCNTDVGWPICNYTKVEWKRNLLVDQTIEKLIVQAFVDGDQLYKNEHPVSNVHALTQNFSSN